MNYARLIPLAALLVLAGCETPSPAQRKLLDSMVGQPELSLIRQFGVPTRSFAANGHNFLAYIDSQTNYTGGGGGWGWGWGGGGWGWGGPGWGGGWGGWGGGPGGFGGYGGGPGWGTAYTSSCQTTFEVAGGKVSAWTMRGDGC